MKLSVCIPQHNRCAYLLAALESIRAQTHRDVEVVVSDDYSTDNSRTEVPRYLAQSGMQYKYIEQEKNLGYDGNLRAALAGATGDYLFILTNDDAIPDPGTLARVNALLERFKPDVAIGNVMAAHSGTPVRRVMRTHAVTGDPECAVTMFRALSCVTGLIFARDAFSRLDTPRYDGSVFFQMYLGSSIIAGGGQLLTIDECIAHIGMSVAGARANSYRDTLHRFRRKILPATGGLDEVGRVVCEAIWPHVAVAQRAGITKAVFSQLLACSYAYWLYDYRRNGAPWAAFNLALGCTPSRLLRHTDPSLRTAASLTVPYLGATSSMLVPLWLLGGIKDAVRSYAIRNR